MNRIKGLVTAAYTPMKSDGALKLDVVGQLVEFSLKHRNGGLFIIGSTGEFPSLTMEERKATAEEYVRCSNGRLPIIVNIGSCSGADSAALGAHAAKIGADAVCLMAPFYFRPGTARDLAEFVKSVVPHCGGLPVYIYHAPVMTGVNISMPDFLEIMRDEVPTFAGMKYTNENLYEFMRCIQVSDKMQMMFGRDEMLLSALAAGAEAAVGTTYNYIPRLYNQVIDAFAAGNMAEARKCMDISHKVIKICAGYGLPALKAVMRFAGIDVGAMRLPVAQLTEEQITALGHDLEAAGVMEYFG